MLNQLAAIVAGFIVMMVLSTLVFALVYIAPDFVLQENRAEATLLFSLLTLLNGFVAAIAGGLCATKVAHGVPDAARNLATVVLVLGMGMAFVNLASDPVDKSDEEIAAMPVEERIKIAREPYWYSFTLPIIGASGVLIGASRGTRKKEPTAD